MRKKKKENILKKILTALAACSWQRGKSCLISKTGTQHWVLSANLAVQ